MLPHIYRSHTDQDRRVFMGIFSGYPPNNTYTRDLLGASNSTPLLGDYDGDGQTDFAEYLDGDWVVYLTSYGQETRRVRFGSVDELPLTGDYDGDGATDLAVWNRRTGVFRVFSSGLIYGKKPPHMNYNGGFEFIRQWGLEGMTIPSM